jgi:hypothetical protein
MDQSSREHRKGCSHQRCRRQQHCARKQEAPETEGKEAGLKLLPDQRVDIVDPLKQERDEQSVDGDPDLHPAVSR